MRRSQLLLLSVCLIVISAGCRNYGNHTCGGGAFAGGPTIAPPPTYSLNIPSVASNQPYYTPGQTAPTNNTLNTNQRAPTPAVRQANQQYQGGWRSSDDNLSRTNNVAPLNRNTDPDTGNSVLAAPSTFANNTSNTNSGSATRTASLTALPGSGASFTSSPDYQTTRVNETQDATRLPLSDATAVRAPARNFPTGTPLAVQSNAYPANYQAGVVNPQYPATYVAQAGVYQQAPTGYSASPVIIGGQPVRTGYQGQPLIANPLNNQQYPAFSPPAVLAQATTTATPGAGSQLGWRDRDLTGSRSNRF